MKVKVMEYFADVSYHFIPIFGALIRLILGGRFVRQNLAGAGRVQQPKRVA